jgi:hypothetical protein
MENTETTEVKVYPPNENGDIQFYGDTGEEEITFLIPKEGAIDIARKILQWFDVDQLNNE